MSNNDSYNYMHDDHPYSTNLSGIGSWILVMVGIFVFSMAIILLTS